MAIINGSNFNDNNTINGNPSILRPALNGGDDSDIVNGNDGSDILNGNGSSDILSGGAGSDTLNGGVGSDILNGDAGSDILNGDAGSDILDGGADNDILDGGADNDSLNGGTGSDTLNGGTGNDTFTASQGNDNINGGDGIDTADYSQLNQTITLSGVGTVQKGGGLGQDQLFRVERVVASAAVANNTIDASASLPGVSITVNLATQSLAANNVPGLGTLSFTAVNFDNVIGTNANDNIVGDGQDNRLVGLGGNDNITGGAGNDTLRGEDGDDNIIGGAGNDRITGGNGTDVLTGETGNDVFNYDSISQSLPGLLRDAINDFVGNGSGLGDQFDLSDIDANPFLPGNQAFTFGGAFALGSLRYVGGILQGNLNFDAAAEFEIRLVGAPALFVAAGNPGSDIIL